MSIRILVLVTALLLLLQGCSTAAKKQAATAEPSSTAPHSTTLNPLNHPPSSHYKNDNGLHAVSRYMAAQLVQNQAIENLVDNPIAITSFVNIKSYDQADAIGETLADNMIHEMQIRGFKVIDYKTMPSIRVSDKGDFIRSRSVDELRKKQQINLVLSGTYTQHRRGIHINARITTIESGLVVSTAQGTISRTIVDSILNAESPRGEESDPFMFYPQEAPISPQGGDSSILEVIPVVETVPLEVAVKAEPLSVEDPTKKSYGCFQNGICMQSR
ncbi:MAG: hypothetical protein HN842_09910 [Gammaproteobacteria bacterium]|jgi:TolB-like protein|nr:hypothetical protein [Gammaproteobacteria bacterium]MBT7308521.1 hypothetical protein [Gammaproteobacteria bacterium]